VATWTDGPRYAPLERPAGFAEPTSGVSLAPEDPTHPVIVDSPADPPSGFQRTGPQVPLESIVSTPTDTRDPRTPFTAVSSLLTDTGGANGSRTALEPFRIVSSAPTAALTWAPPPPGAKPVVARRPVSIRDCLTAAYPPFLITIFVCGFVGLTSSAIAVIILAGTPFIFVPHVAVRRTHLRMVNFIILGVLAALWIVSLILDSSMYNVDFHMPVWIMLGCWGLALADIVLQWMGLSRGEASPPRTANPW